MAIYNKFPNLARQTENPINMSYYGGLSKPNPIGNSLGNQSIAKTGTTAPQFSHGYQGNLYGSIGRNVTDVSTGDRSHYANQPDRYDPRFYEAYEENMGDAGTQTQYRLRPEYANRLNGRVQLGSANVGGSHGDIIDPSRVEWDDEFGFLNPTDNFVVGADPLAETIFPALTLATMGAGAAGAFGYGPFAAGGLGESGITMVDNGLSGIFNAGEAGLTSTGAGTMAGNSLANYATMTGGLDGGGLSLLPSTGVGAAAGVGTGAAASGGGFPWRSVLGLAGGVGNLIMGNRTQNQFNDAANRADPFGTANRQRAQEMLWQLYSDPSSIENTPGYRFARDQGEQGIERQAAQRGYFRSPNMLYDLSKFNQNLAQQTYNAEVQRLMAMAGVQFDPSNAANIQANGIARSNTMRAGGLTDILESGESILDWIMDL